MKLLLPVLLLTGIATAAVAALAPSGSVAVQDSPKTSLLSLSKAENALWIVDPATGEADAKVPVGVGPHEIAIDTEGKFAYVTEYGTQRAGNTIGVVDLAKGERVAEIDLGPLARPHGMAIVKDKLYFTSEVARAVGRVDLETRKLDWISGVGEGTTHMLAVGPDGMIYTTNISGDSVTVIDPSAGGGQSVRHIKTAPRPEGIAVSPDGKWIVAGHVEGGKLTVIDTKTLKITDEYDLGGALIRLAFSPDGATLYATDAQGGRFLALDFASRTLAGTVAIGEMPVGFVVAPDGKTAYISLMGGTHIAVVDTASMTISNRIAVGGQPDGIALVTSSTK